MMSIEDIVDILSLDLIGVIPDDENVVVAANQGESLTGYHTPAGKAYENICRRIMGEDVPLACHDLCPGLVRNIRMIVQYP